MVEKGKAMMDAFPITKVASKRARAAKTTPWGQRDVLEEGGGEGVQGEAKRIKTEHANGNGLAAAVAEASKFHLTTVNVLDFPKMLAQVVEGNNEEEVGKVLDQMKAVIISLVEAGVDGANRATKALVLLRQGSIDLSRGEEFNNFLRDLLVKLPPAGEMEEFWDSMAEQGTTLITKEEQSPGVEVTKKDAEDFIQKMKERAVAVKEEVVNVEPEDDLDLE